MSDPPQEPRPGGLGARLHALRREYPTLAVLTEIIQFDERRVTFRATVLVDGETRAQGHAAKGADPAGDFVAEAEQLAVAQALLLGGFGTTEDVSPTVRAANPLPTLPEQPLAPQDESSATAGSAGPAATRRGRRMDHPTRANASPPGMGDTANRGSVPAPEPSGGASDDAATPAAPPTSPISTPAAAMPTDVAAGTAPDEIEATAAPAELPPAPRRKRPRAGQTATVPEAQAGESADRPRPADRPEPATATQPLAPAEDAAPTVTQTPPLERPTAETSPEVPETPPTTAPRRAPSRSTRQAEPAPDAPIGQEALRAAWRAGQPIPAWWPPDRVAVTKPLTKSQVDRLRAVALDEEITASQLDSYSAMLFGSAVAALNQAQGAILEERLNPAYPSPLQELRARRLIHPIAVGDTVPIPDGQSAFIRWRDVPPAEEAPASPAPAAPSWRAGGVQRGGTRRRR